ncbi:glycosyl transferase family 1 [Malikia spinosa]|uniref:Glycosyl transferase family 1 n=1 Tax=Malikia spinosa TaxID=86180 RepID=A0A2S9KD66_9BURK|nr:glycosyltransferase [Malikia spinosa]PRD68390.1 glycosyl transferase family 1 [Malikia spinosa]
MHSPKIHEYRILINASNLHTGGGVQVATSFIHEISQLGSCDLNLTIFASTAVTNNLKKINSPSLQSLKITTIDTFGISGFFSKLNSELVNYKIIFTIFGPNYLRSKKQIQIVGFAQPWIIDKSAYQIFSIKDKFNWMIKYAIQALFFKNADKLVVELEHVKHGLIKAKIADEKSIEVVRNCISSLYLNANSWEPIENRINKNNFTVGYVGRDYPHKNTNILPFIKEILKNKYALDVDFCVTLTNNEWLNKTSDFKKNIINIGELSVSQCPSFYQAVDAVIFPSLLECFSATPLEAMVMRKPLFASDRGFVRDVCKDFAFYFDPLNPESAADVIATYIKKRIRNDTDRLEKARAHVLQFSNARGRAERYLDIIRNTLEEHEIKSEILNSPRQLLK